MGFYLPRANTVKVTRRLSSFTGGGRPQESIGIQCNISNKELERVPFMSVHTPIKHLSQYFCFLASLFHNFGFISYIKFLFEASTCCSLRCVIFETFYLYTSVRSKRLHIYLYNLVSKSATNILFPYYLECTTNTCTSFLFVFSYPYTAI